jgi:hypothetical protein
MRHIHYGWHLDGDKIRKGLFLQGGRPVKVFSIGAWFIAAMMALFGWMPLFPEKIDSAKVAPPPTPPTWVTAASSG